MQPQEVGADVAFKLTPDELKSLLFDIAQITERAYRRGFQHGHAVADIVSADQVADWRLDRPGDADDGIPNHTTAVGAPGTKHAGDEWDLIARLEKQMQVESMLGSLVATHKSRAAD